MNVPASISVQEARDIIRAHVAPGAVETVSVIDAVGRVLAADLFSDIDVSPFDDSAMDGFAVVAADLAAATKDAPVALTCVAHIGAGSFFEGTLLPGQTARIMTGAPIPAGADAVVKIEDVTFAGDGSVGDAITFVAPVAVSKNIRFAGEEAKAGDLVCKKGEVVTPAGVGLLASCGNLQVPVYRRPVVGLISIGSELVDASEVPGRGMIRNSNVWTMQANVLAVDAIPKVYPTVADDLDQIKSVYAQAAAECDVVVSTGGACLGDFDLTPGIVRELGCIHFERVNVKPGKSQPFGEIDGTPVFVLSGNPAAASLGFELYVRTCLRVMQGFVDTDRPTVLARIDRDVRKKDPRAFMQRALLSQNDQGELEVAILKKQSSALLGAWQKCNCLAVIPAGLEGVAAGDLVTCILTGVDESMPLKATK